MKYSPYINSFEDSSYYGEYLSGGNVGYPNIAYIIDSGDIEVVKTPTHDVFTIECSGNVEPEPEEPDPEDPEEPEEPEEE